MMLSNVLLAVIAGNLGPIMSHSAHMDCGPGVALCGTLTLESGMGPGLYHHQKASVHGLWPEVGSYGTSKCIQPEDTTAPTKIYGCYADANDSTEHILWFESHEWTKHGTCAGVKNADDFFSQVCGLAQHPVEVLEKAKEAGKDMDSMAQALRDSGYPVWSLDEKEDQIMLSACAGSDGHWVLAAVPDMPSKCGGKSPAPYPPSPSPPSPSPPPSPPSGSCVPGKRGPKCSSDDDCKGMDGCERCAHSGYCTDQPLLAVLV